MNNKNNLNLLLKKANELGYSLIEVVGPDEARRLYELAAALEAESGTKN